MTTLFDVEPDDVAPQATLPPLKGSEKQVDWATHIRRGKVRDIERLIGEMQEVARRHEAGGKPDLAAKQRAVLHVAVDRFEGLVAQVSASFWIERRENSARELIANAAPKPGNEWRRE